MKTIYQAIAVLCVYALLQPPVARAGQPAGQPSGGLFAGLTAPYRPKYEAPIRLSNSGRLESLLRAGNIYLSLQDAIALALENNLDIELQRYGFRIAESDILKARAGAAIQGVSSAISAGSSGAGQVGSTATTTGQGLTVYTPGTAPPTLDPVVSTQYNWSHRTTPQTNSFVTGTNALVQTTTLFNSSIQKGFLTGTSVNFGWNNNFVTSNAGRSDFNPSTTASFVLTLSQHLLQGFGLAVNNRYIRIAKNNYQVSDLVFKQQVMTTVAAVAQLYWDLVSYIENVKVKRQALAVSEKLYNDNKKQVEIGTLAPIEVVRAEAEVASNRQALTVAETLVLQQETILKNALSRTGVASPTISEAHIIPTDRMHIPDVEPVEPIQDLWATALENRPELAQIQLQVKNTKIGLEGTRSSMLPSLDLVATLQNNALAGQVNALPIPSIQGLPPQQRNPNSVSSFFIGGYGTILSQLLARNFPDYAIGFQLNVPLRNRSAQADMIRGQLSLRQQEIRQQQLINQIRVEVTNALIALQQARAGYEAAVKARILQEQNLDAEQKKYALGASTIYFVIQAQRDLVQAASNEVAALSAYSKAKVQLDQATGKILTAYNISINEAKEGRVGRAADPLPPAR
jgi:outer membrane protein TolC